MIATLTCNACLTAISPTGIRVICRVCANYDLCSNCHTLSRFSDSHEVQHETIVHYPPTSISRDYHVPPAPPPPLPPHPRPTPLAAGIPTAASKLLSSNNTPTKRLKDISDAVFAYVNKTYPSANQHLLNPGQLSDLFQLIGFEENSFSVLIGAMNVLGCSLDNIDPEVAHMYDRLGIEYSLITRADEGAPLVAINSMPVLNHHGFRQLLVCEILEDPGRAHSFFQQLVRLAVVGDSGRAFEELPRRMFPPEPDPTFTVKVAAVAVELSERAEVLFARLKYESEEESRWKMALAEQEMVQMQIEQQTADMAAQFASRQLVLEAQHQANQSRSAAMESIRANIR